jgi:hypothetical protein
MPCPVDLVAIPALVAAATAIGNARRLMIKNSWYEGPRLNAAIICDSGSKKSPAIAAAMAPLWKAQNRLKAEYLEKVMQHVEQPASPPQRPTFQQIITTDATVEALACMLEANPRGVLLAHDELASWTLSLNQYRKGRGADRQFWLSVWGGASLVVNRKGQEIPICVSNPLVNVAGCIPPDIFQELQDEHSREDGFLPRILLSWPDPLGLHWSDAEPDSHITHAYEELFEKLFALQGATAEESQPVTPKTLQFTDTGKEAFTTFVAALGAELQGDTFPDNLRAVWAKLEAYCARLALVLHMCRFVSGEVTSEEIDAESVANAICLIDYFKAHARRVYGRLLNRRGTRADRDIQAVLDWLHSNRHAIGTHSPPSFHWRNIRHDLRSRFGAGERDLANALKALEERDYIREIPMQAGPGRKPKPRYAVNPQILEQKDQKDQKDQKALCA